MISILKECYIFRIITIIFVNFISVTDLEYFFHRIIKKTILFRYIRLLTNVLDWQHQQETRYDVQVKCESVLNSDLICGGRNVLHHNMNGLRLRARIRRNSSMMLLQNQFPVCDRNGNNLLMIAPPKDGRNFGDVNAHRIKIEMVEDKEEEGGINKNIQNGNSDNGDVNTATGRSSIVNNVTREKRKRMDRIACEKNNKPGNLDER